MIISLVFTPTLVAKWKGMYKLNKYSYMIATVGRLLVVVAGYMGIVPLMFVFTAIAALDGNTAVQPDSCINMMYIMYLWIPFVIDFLITIILSFMNVEDANAKLRVIK